MFSIVSNSPALIGRKTHGHMRRQKSMVGCSSGRISLLPPSACQTASEPSTNCASSVGSMEIGTSGPGQVLSEVKCFFENAGTERNRRQAGVKSPASDRSSPARHREKPRPTAEYRPSEPCRKAWDTSRCNVNKAKGTRASRRISTAGLNTGDIVHSRTQNNRLSHGGNVFHERVVIALARADLKS